ncbi:MAG: ATPase, partial [Actinobacteria bacterium]|nr:ATPase [Actinomycetota bacterium]
MQDSQSQKNSLDGSIDSFIEAVSGIVSRQLKWLVLLAIFAAVFWTFLLPTWQKWLPMVGYGALMLFQLAFAVMFMIVQFGALFWFLGRGRTYWVKPGETGVGF